MDTVMLQSTADRLFARKRFVAFAIPTAVLAYLVYIFFAFDIPRLAERARPENAMTLISDTYSHKVHVTRDNRSAELSVSIEGDRNARYPGDRLPEWVFDHGNSVRIELPGRSQVRFLPDSAAVFEVEGYGPIEARVGEDGIEIDIPEDALPGFVSYSSARLDIRTEAGRLTMTRSRTEVFRYFFGWELFLFTLDSPYYGHSVTDILFGPQIDPDRSNMLGALEDFWGNSIWRHKDVAWALGETLLMAFLGTMGAALIALPMAFLAARNFAPVVIVRQLFRRLFDFLRGVDALIWTILLSRAFGPGPLTGALAILFTDSGTFGKLFSEALENVDQKQIEGVTSTGAKPLQRYRFGVVPQIFPVLLSQVLYYLESNTRSATIIGAITGGGIGLLLTQAIITQKDWEEVTYYVTLIVFMVMLMDMLSGYVRSRLIGNAKP